jgi:HEAT repeat protein
MLRRFLFPLAGLVALTAVMSARADDPAVAADEKQLRDAGLPIDGPGLLDFIRLRTRGETTPKHLSALIEQLGAPTAAQREKACAELIAVGPLVVPLLRQAVKDVDSPARSELAQRCLDALEKDSTALTGTAARMLAVRKPAGAAEALFAFLPAAEDDRVIEEVRNALAVLAYRDGKPLPVLMKGLEDPVSLRRSVAVEVLCQNGLAEPRDVFRKLLDDPKPSVRLKAALALAHVQDARAVETLIAILGELPLELGRQVEDCLNNLAGDLGPKAPLTDDASRARAKEAWSAWWKGNDGPNLLAELRKRTVPDADLKRAIQLVDRLGDESFDEREKAMDEIRRLGTVAVRALRDAQTNPDLEIKNRAKDLLAEVEKNKGVPVSPVVPRLLALRKPAGAPEALLAFLPFTEDTNLIAETQTALNATAYVDGKLDAAVLKALNDRYPIRRAAAAEAVCQLAAPEQQAAVRRLLTDPESTVRLQAALGLAMLRDKSAVPVLIEQIREAEPERLIQIEDYLNRLADGKGPADLPSGYGEEPRQKRSEMWAQWWTAHSDKAELPERQSLVNVTRHLGLTLLIHQAQPGTISEIGADGKERWKMTGLFNPVDARVLPGGRVLVAEMGNQRVTERTLKGDILWTKQTPGNGPTNVDRLPNGNTLIATRMQILEVDRSGKDVFTYNRPFGDIMSAFKGRDGQYVIVSNQAMIVRVDSTGKEVKSCRIPGVSNFGNELLPNGHVLIPLSWQNKVTEYDPDGKVVWEANVVQPMAATRLPNGHTLVALQQWPSKLIELDRAGKQVAETGLSGYVNRVRHR